jgi:uracil phosphoribosyltransferase
MIRDLTNDPLARLLVNRTRLATTESTELVEAHRRVGELLAQVIAKELSLEEYDIQHVTGPSRGVRLTSGKEPIIIALLRAGLFLAEGIRESLPGSSLVLLSGHDDDLPVMSVSGRPLVLVDAVINTGASIRPLIGKLRGPTEQKVMVSALVGHRPGVEALARDFPTVEFVLARLSDHSYVGKGSTDTGARLFGTTGWPSERR